MSNLNIYTRLMAGIGNTYGVCALMGNIKAESTMRSNNLQDSGNKKLNMTDEEYTAAVDNGTYKAFATDSKGYGLCQWTSSGRKQALLNFAKAAGKSIGDEDMQVDFILYELSTSYKSVLTVLKSAKSVKEASDCVVKKFERPKDQSEGVLSARAGKGIEFYNMFDKEVKDMLTGKGLAEFAISKLGMPYFYGAKIPNGVLTEKYMQLMNSYYPSTVTSGYMDKARKRGQVGKVNVDCSGLPAAYRSKNIGSSQLYSTAYTRLPISQVQDFAVGVILWKSGHVGVYIGMENGVPMCVEAKGINYGVVKTKVADTKWQYGLTFSDLTYSYETAVSGTWKGTNPYKEPTRTIQKGCIGDDVKWIQWELREAGFDVPFNYNGKQYKAVVIDGDAGQITDAAIRAYQASCKITVDGKCGPKTKSYLKNS